MTPEEDKLIQDHPIESFYYNADDFATFQSALTESYPEPDTMEHLVYCEDGFYFHKGSMPFKGLLKQDLCFPSLREGQGIFTMPCTSQENRL